MEIEVSSIIDALPGLIWTTLPDGFADFFNKRWLEYTGLHAEGVLGWGWQAAVHPDDIAPLVDYWRSRIASGKGGETEARLRRHDGEFRWFHFQANPLTDSTGRIIKWCGINTDIEELKRAEEEARAHKVTEALRTSERNLRETINAIPTLAWCNRVDGSNEFLNKRWHDYTGLPPQEAQGWGWQVTLHPDDLPKLLEKWSHMLATGESGEIEARLQRFDGVYRWFLFRCDPLRDESGAIVKWYGTNTDIEDRKRAEEAVAASERYLRETINAIPALVFCNRADGPNEYLNQKWHDYTGISPEEARNNGWQVPLHPDDLPKLMQRWLVMLKTGETGEVEGRLRRFDGVYRWFLFRTDALRDASGKIVKWYGTCTDIDDLKHAEAELKRANEHLNEAQRLSHTGSFTTDLVKDEHVWSDELYRICDFEPGSRITVKRFQDIVHPEDAQAIQAVIEDAIRGVSRDVTYRIITPKGAQKHLRTVGRIVERVEGRFLIAGAIQDVTESKVREDALRRSEAFLAQGEAVSQTGSFLWRLETNELLWSKQLFRIFEFELETPITLERIAGRVHPEDLWLMDQMVGRAQAGEDSEYHHRLLMPDGSIKHLHFVARATRDQEGRREYIGVVQDITDRRLAEQALSKVRSELAHVARVTSLNALTASIAHEVNQPLSGIITNASTCLRMLGADPPNVDGARETARRTIRDGNRASEVIKRLRALFAKKGESTEPVDLNEATREVVALSQNELERSSVSWRLDLAEDLPLVSGDRVQLQQVILNLVLNASDAMIQINDRPRLLSIKTLWEDDQVRLTVQDSGTGIDPHNATKLFDAFYSTKPNGMGIGLSVSRSIIEGHHGRLWAASNEGPGASVSFSIPCNIDRVLSHERVGHELQL